MNIDLERVLVAEGPCNACGTPTVQIRHQSFPEFVVTDSTTQSAAELLVNRLIADLDAVSIPARRERTLLAVDDIRAFLEREFGAHPVGHL
ncbi:MAG: hypothetical protein WBC44_04085 [Planctomycetaceae bacterium]